VTRGRAVDEMQRDGRKNRPRKDDRNGRKGNDILDELKVNLKRRLLKYKEMIVEEQDK
jgi:hypothetical protein